MPKGKGTALSSSVFPERSGYYCLSCSLLAFSTQLKRHMSCFNIREENMIHRSV